MKPLVSVYWWWFSQSWRGRPAMAATGWSVWLSADLPVLEIGTMVVGDCFKLFISLSWCLWMVHGFTVYPLKPLVNTHKLWELKPISLSLSLSLTLSLSACDSKPISYKLSPSALKTKASTVFCFLFFFVPFCSEYGWPFEDPPPFPEHDGGAGRGYDGWNRKTSHDQHLYKVCTVHVKRIHVHVCVQSLVSATSSCWVMMS